MQPDKVEKFMQLAGQKVNNTLSTLSAEERALGARLLLSEVLEYVIEGLGVTPVVGGVSITDPEEIVYADSGNEPARIEMVDGLADVAYTMYWNALAFGVPLDRAFDLVCDNNLEKFVKVNPDLFKAGSIPKDKWHCEQGVNWPEEVVSVSIVPIKNELFAVGKDKGGKVRKPSTYKSVDLTGLTQQAQQ